MIASEKHETLVKAAKSYSTRKKIQQKEEKANDDDRDEVCLHITPKNFRKN